MEDQKFIENIVKEVVTDIMSKNKDICHCADCHNAVLDKISKILLSSTYISQMICGLNRRAQGIDVQIKAEAARELSKILVDLKVHPLHPVQG
jgi:hypothetical protein